MLTLAHVWSINHALHDADAQNVCALTKVGTVLKTLQSTSTNRESRTFEFAFEFEFELDFELKIELDMS